MAETFLEKRRRYNRDWIKNNRARYNFSKATYRAKVKASVIAFYSNGSMSCAYCGFDNIDGLCLDHINDDGAAQRKALFGIRRGGINFYEKVQQQGFPSDLQVLCANCNLIKEVKRRRGD